jgi:hypothetical protein
MHFGMLEKWINDSVNYMIVIYDSRYSNIVFYVKMDVNVSSSRNAEVLISSGDTKTKTIAAIKYAKNPMPLRLTLQILMGCISFAIHLIQILSIQVLLPMAL